MTIHHRYSGYALALLVTVLALGRCWGEPTSVEIVTVPPDARVFLDGRYQGLSPCRLQLANGRGKLKLEKDGFPTTYEPHTLLQQKTQELEGHRFAVPYGWEQGENGHFRLHSRRARFTVAMDDSFENLRKERERQGWTVVGSQVAAEEARFRLERDGTRAALVLKRVDGRLIRLDYEYSHCTDLFEYTRDLDFLRAALGF